MDEFSIRREPAPMKKLLLSALISPEMHPDRVGERITALREALGLSKAEFADSLQLDRSTLTKVEQGSRGLDVVVGARIADLYNAGMDYIYRGQLSDVPEPLRPKVMAYTHSARAARLFGTKSVTIAP